MGPPLFSGGNEPRDKRRCAVSGLQWGRRFSAAEMFEGFGTLVPREVLQWGRRFSAAEMHPRTGQGAGRHWASMGPPLFSGGNTVIRACIADLPAASMGPPLFSGGNTLRDAHLKQRATQASMGPPLFSGGNRPGESITLIIEPASMGPPLFSGGNSALRKYPVFKDLRQRLRAPECRCQHSTLLKQGVTRQPQL